MTATIMMVDDNPITRKMVRFTLENHGFAVVDVPDGATAVQAFARQPIALVLQDLMLPDIDGFELVQRLRALPGGADIPILAFSGLLSKLEEARISAVGFDDVISKPVEPSRLLQIVRTHLPSADSPPYRDLFGKGRRVIVADDDPVQRKLVVFRLEKVGFEALAVADGMEALEQTRRVLPDVVVSDVLMPRLDGFGLCINIRRDERLAHIPVVLITNSYVEGGDRELAHKAGANDLVLRTPELREVMETLRTSLGTTPPPTFPSAPESEFEGERMNRVMRQLERQVALNAGVTQRCALLSAELAVLNGISEALASHDDIDSALRHALAACFDAGGISLGALYICDNGALRVVSFGLSSAWTDQDLGGFFGEPEVLDQAIRTQKTIAIPSEDVSAGQHERFLARAGASSALIVPLLHKGKSLGALVMMSKTLEMSSPDRVMFSQAVAGQIGQALAVTRAFAQQQASERMAKEQAAVLRSILDSIADAVVVSDEHGKFIHWNPAAIRIMRMGSVDVIRDDWSMKVGLFESDRVTPISTERSPLFRAMHGESVERMEMFVRHDRAPEGVWLSVNARPWKDENERIRGGVAAFRDVTQEKAAQTQLMVSDRMASVGMLAAGVAHEINNPLAAVLANLELIQRELLERTSLLGDTQDVREMIDDARGASDRVRQIVQDLKIFSRHEEVKSGAVDVSRVIESSLRMARNEIRHRARLVKEYGRDLGPVEGTESRLGQVFLNLIVNAAQAIPEGNADKNIIRVTTRRDPTRRIAVEIADTGSGIPPDALPRLFTPFFTTKAAGVGTGLGLAICHRIVTGLGGEIQVESEVGKGTTFRVLLPAATTTEAEEKPSLGRTMRAQRRARILVVDDEPMIGAVIRRSLVSEHEVVVTNEASDGLAMVRDGESFDVILCDLMMPQMTGMEFHGEMRKINAEYANRIIFLTGGAFTPAARAFLDEVGNQRVEKPFDPQHLRDLVNGCIK